MKKFAFVILLSVAACGHSAHAQQPDPNKVYTLSVTTPELNTIASALQERPFKDVVQLLNKLQEQVSAQNAAPKKEEEGK